MLKPEQVPLDVWIALRDYVRERPYGYDYTEAIAAALNAWPGIQAGSDDDGMTLSGVYLPLTQEARDAD